MNVVIVQQAVEQAQDVADVEKAQQRINKVQKEASQQVLPQHVVVFMRGCVPDAAVFWSWDMCRIMLVDVARRTARNGFLLQLFASKSVAAAPCAARCRTPRDDRLLQPQRSPRQQRPAPPRTPRMLPTSRRRNSLRKLPPPMRFPPRPSANLRCHVWRGHAQHAHPRSESAGSEADAQEQTIRTGGEPR